MSIFTNGVEPTLNQPVSLIEKIQFYPEYYETGKTTLSTIILLHTNTLCDSANSNYNFMFYKPPSKDLLNIIRFSESSREFRLV